ncbi:polyprenol phosphomannose-dependent alpha 1,6 mannosyltransferase MptB [Salinifilum aidingensis]
MNSPTPFPEAAEPPPRTSPLRWHDLFRGPLPLRTIALGAAGSLLVLLGSLGAGGTLMRDPVLGDGPLSLIRYGHGRELALAVTYLGFAVLLWAWIRLGRGVLAHLVPARGVLLAGAAWMAPLLIAPPLFTRDVYSYLGQGLLVVHGLDPYALGPAVLNGPIPENVHPTWHTTPAPYGPLFIAISTVMAWAVGEHVLVGVIAFRLLVLLGLVLFAAVLPGLVRHLGGRLPVALWIAVASPLTVTQLVGGPHNDLLVVGLLAAGALLALRGFHVSAVAVVTVAMAIKATAGVLLPFLVWIWASNREGPLGWRFLRSVVPALGVFGAVFGACTAVAGVGFGWLPALSAPSIIVNYLSVPTGVGQAVHGLVSLFADVPGAVFIETGRALGMLALAGVLVHQWWQARNGGAEAIRRAAIALCAAALLGPTVLPWYLSWSMALACALPWSKRALTVLVGGQVVLVLAYYPDGEQGMFNWPYMAGVVALALLAAASLLRFDPLNLHGPRPARGDASAPDDAHPEAGIALDEPATAGAGEHTDRSSRRG